MSRLTISVPETIAKKALSISKKSSHSSVSSVFSDALDWYNQYLEHQNYLKQEIQKGLDDYKTNGAIKTNVKDIITKMQSTEKD